VVRASARTSDCPSDGNVYGPVGPAGSSAAWRAAIWATARPIVGRVRSGRGEHDHHGVRAAAEGGALLIGAHPEGDAVVHGRQRVDINQAARVVDRADLGGGELVVRMLGHRDHEDGAGARLEDPGGDRRVVE